MMFSLDLDSWRVLLLFCSLLMISHSECSQVVPNSITAPMRVTRTDGLPDRFASTRLPCSSLNWCAAVHAKASLEEVPKESLACVCQCPVETPIFQDDIATCVPHVAESEGCRRVADWNNPIVQLPPYGHIIINRKINLQPSDASVVRCAIEECLFLSADGWTSFSAIRIGNQPPRFKLIQQPAAPHQDAPVNPMIYNLQWLGSSEHAEFLQGRLILLTTICNASAAGLLQPLSVCLPMRIAGTSGRLKSLAMMDSSSPPHDNNDTVETGVLVAAACGGALGVLYVIVLAIFITSRLRKSRKLKQNRQPFGDTHDTVMCDDLEKNVVGPLEAPFASEQALEYNATSYSAWPEDLAFRHRLMQIRSRGPSSLPMRYFYSPPPFFLNDVLIVQTPDAIRKDAQMQDVIHSRVENKLLPKPPVRRRKVFFDPQYLDTEYLKNPSDAAENFRAQIHCMINITKSRLDKRRFLPNLEMIDEENANRKQLPLSHEDVIQSAVPVTIIDEEITCLDDESPSRPNGKKISRDLDAVVLQIEPKALTVANSTSPVDDPGKDHKDWSQILKDEWGSNESISRIPHRRRIQEVFQKNSDSGTKPAKSLSRSSPDGGAQNGTSNKKSIFSRKAIVAKDENTVPEIQSTTKIKPMPTKPSSDDEESDKASSRSGTGSNPEKDSGIEDDVNSDKPNKSSSHKVNNKDLPTMISRRKIVSANAVNVPLNAVKTRSNGSLHHQVS